MTDNPSDLDVAEFFVLRRYRRIGVGRLAARALWAALPARWVVRVAEGNSPALAFWLGVVPDTGGNYIEVTRDSGGRRWRVFSFDSANATRA